MESSKLELLERIDEAESIIIYGAGEYGKKLYEWIRIKGYVEKKVVAFAVTDMKGNSQQVDGLQVKEISSLKGYAANVLVIIAVSKNYQNEIRECLTSLGFCSVCGLNIHLYNEIKREIKEHNDAKRMLSCVDKRILWDYALEKRVVQENWGNVTEEEGFKEKFLDLIRGVDAESVTTVVRILDRQKKYLNSDDRVMDLYTEKEQQELRRQQQEFWEEIFEVTPELYVYRNYLMKRNVFEPSVFFYKHGVDKLKYPEKICGMNIFDVGGFVGDSVMVLEELKPKTIYTFEGVPAHYDELCENLELNGISNCIAEKCALGDFCGTISMKLSGSGTTAIDRKGLNYKGEIEVPIITLDKYVEDNNIDNIGLIKVDIEGSEPYFLKGAKNTIVRFKPTLLLSIYHNAHDFFMLKPMIESWNLGYEFQIFKPINRSFTGETLLLAEVKDET